MRYDGPLASLSERIADRLVPFTQWIDRLRMQRLPLDTPPPSHYQTYDEWLRNSRGVNAITGQRAPETDAERFRRMRGIDPVSGRPATVLNDPLFNSPSRIATAPIAPMPPPTSTTTAPSSFVRRLTFGAGVLSSRLTALGRAVRGGTPVLSAVSTMLHAIRAGSEAERSVDPDLRADAGAPSRSGTAAPRLG